MKRHIVLHLFLTLLIYQEISLAQIGKVAVPYSVTYHLDPIEEFVDIQRLGQLKTLDNESVNQSERLKKQYFARIYQVEYHPNNSGTWEETAAGRVWRLGITSEGAYSLYEVFDRFRLEPETKLFIYNKNKSDFAGAITSANNNDFNVLSVAPLSGESIIIELNVTAGIQNFGEMILTQVGHDFINAFGETRQKIVLDDPAGSCNVDINCAEGKEWQSEKNAVCRILVNGQLCTGTLINNVPGEKIPYLLTACHCVEDSASASSAMFFLGYERPVCNKSGGEKAFSLSGASLIATTNRLLDFSLLKLNQYPPAYYNPYFSGWDAGTSPPQGGVCIHYPNGNPKKISVDNDPLTTGDFGEGFDQNSHWVVSRWEVGSTEGGSSGAPFFNNSHKLCGTLTGGDASCKNPVNDFFLKFHLAWDKYPDSLNQLKYWLDPDNTGITEMNGICPYELSQTQFDSYTNTKGEYVQVNRNNLSWGVISGHNSSGFSQFAEKFYTPSPIQLSGMYLGISDRYYSDIFATFFLKIWNGSNMPEKEIYTQEVYISSLIRSTTNYFFFDSLITVTDTFFAGYSIDYRFPDTLAPYTVADRGINGSSYMYIYNGLWHNINEVTKPPVNTSLALGIISPNGINPTLEVKRTLKITPNPCSDYIRIEFSNEMLPVEIECYDITGRCVSLEFERTETGYYINTSLLTPGIYSLVIHTNTEKHTARFIVIR